jgi:triphosphoribosyl-dephospho-CoA synthase
MSEIERCVRTACFWEATARKAGNVHPFAEFDDLTYADFVRSGETIAPVLEAYRDRPLGITILEAIRATRTVVNTNTNLGIVLLLAPLSKVDLDSRSRLSVSDLLNSTTVTDAKHVYKAIRLAFPGGMGRVEKQDVADEPTQTLKEVMTLASDRDMIARQYANGFVEILNEGVPALLDALQRFQNTEGAILTCQIRLLAQYPDSLVVRKCGLAEAQGVQSLARAIESRGGLATADGLRSFKELDRWLRAEGHSRNPGTTADLVTACLFVALREHRMNVETPFEFPELSK